MAKNSRAKSEVSVSKGRRNAAQVARIVLGLLLVLNVVAVGLVLYPPGGSAEALEQDLVRLQGQVQQAKARLEETKKHSAAVEKGRGSADEFLNQYFVTERTLPTTLLTELGRVAQRAGIKDRGVAYSKEPIDGSDVLGTETITANFEGTYRNLLDFVREVDRSPSLLIIDSLNAAPIPGSNVLSVTMKMVAFVRDDGTLAPAQVAELKEAGK